MADNHPLDEIGIPWEVVFAIRCLDPFSFNMAENITLPHQVQNPFVVYHPALTLQLMGNSTVPVTRKLKADSFNTIYQVGLCLHLPSSLRFGFMVEAASGKIHQPTPPPDTAEEMFPPYEDFPFLPYRLMLLCNPFFKNSF